MTYAAGEMARFMRGVELRSIAGGVFRLVELAVLVIILVRVS